MADRFFGKLFFTITDISLTKQDKYQLVQKQMDELNTATLVNVYWETVPTSVT